MEYKLLDFFTMREDTLKAILKISGRKEQQLIGFMIDQHIVNSPSGITLQQIAELIGYELNNARRMVKKLYHNGILAVAKKGLDDVWYLNHIDHSLKAV